MSRWLPHDDLARLLEALDREIIAASDAEVHAACFEDGDLVHTAAKDLRAMIGALIDDPDDAAAGRRPLEIAGGRECRPRHH